MVEYLKEAVEPSVGQAQAADEVALKVKQILEQVRAEKDQAILSLNKKFDGVELDNLRVDKKTIEKAYSLVPRETLEKLRFAAGQIREFAERQLSCLQPLEYKSHAGVVLGHRLVPVAACGAYIPGGRYPLPSSALMSIIPARVAGVERVAACSPPSRDYGAIHPAVLVAMDIAGAGEIFCMGGAQAIGAYAYGTETVGRVDMIVGPGNHYVTEAKRQVSGMVGIDSLAGPSEVLIIADETANPEYVAADLLAQCEHDPSARGILVTTSRRLADEAIRLVESQLLQLETAAVAAKAWQENGQVILVESLDEAAALADRLAPEHLELQTEENGELAGKIRNYGSLFMGSCATVSFGDYVSGTNHILPTMGCARFANGVWAGTFIKVQSYQELDREGAAYLAGACSHLAGLEGLSGHKRAALLRLGQEWIKGRL